MEDQRIIAMWIVVGLGALLAVVALNVRGKKTKRRCELARLDVQATPDKPIGFGCESSWIAVQAADEAVVSEVLGLRDIVACNWTSGLKASSRYPERFVFVTPPLEGWVLAVGGGLPDPDDFRPSTRWASLMRKLSRRFTSAHFFASYRAFNYALWVRYVNGQERRIVCYDNDEILTKGEATPEETGLTDTFNLIDRFPEEKDVVAMADRWCISPMGLEARSLGPSVGLLGR